MAGKKEKGYRYPKSKINSLASAYFTGGASALGGNPSEGSGDILGEAEEIDNDLDSTITTAGLPPEPTLQKPNWARRILSKGGAMDDYDKYRNQLELSKYQYQLQQLISVGKYDAARQLAENKGKMDAVKAQQDQKDKLEIESVSSGNTIKEAQAAELAKRGIITPDLDSAIKMYNQAGYGTDASLNKLKVEGLESGIKGNLLASPSGEDEYTQSLVSGYRKGGFDNRATEATIAKTQMDTRLAPYLKVGANDALINPLNTGASFYNQAPVNTEKLNMETGLTTKSTIPGQVVGINAQDGSKVTIRPMTPDMRPTFTNGASRTQLPSAITNPQQSVIPTVADNQDVEFFDLLIKRLRDQMGNKSAINF